MNNKKLLIILGAVLVIVWLWSLTIKPVSKGDCKKWLVKGQDWICIDDTPLSLNKQKNG